MNWRRVHALLNRMQDDVRSGEQDTESVQTETESQQALRDSELANIDSKADIVERHGMMPARFVTEWVRENGGLLPQQAIVDRTGLSRRQVTRLLQTLEARDEIERVRIRSEKLVVLPE